MKLRLEETGHSYYLMSDEKGVLHKMKTIFNNGKYYTNSTYQLINKFISKNSKYYL